MPFEHKDLNLSPRTHVKKAKGRLICNPSTGQTKTRGSLGLTGQLVLPNWWAPVPSERLWKDGWCSCIPEDNIYAHTHAHTATTTTPKFSNSTVLPCMQSPDFSLKLLLLCVTCVPSQCLARFPHQKQWNAAPTSTLFKHWPIETPEASQIRELWFLCPCL